MLGNHWPVATFFFSFFQPRTCKESFNNGSRFGRWMGGWFRSRLLTERQFFDLPPFHDGSSNAPTCWSLDANIRWNMPPRILILGRSHICLESESMWELADCGDLSWGVLWLLLWSWSLDTRRRHHRSGAAWKWAVLGLVSCSDGKWIITHVGFAEIYHNLSIGSQNFYRRYI